MVLHSFFNSRFNDFLRFFLWLSDILVFLSEPKQFIMIYMTG